MWVFGEHDRQEAKTPPKFGSFKEKTYICSQELEYYDYGNIGTR